MKAFEKWWHEELDDEQFEKEGGFVETDEEHLEMLVKATWKAAFECMREKLDFSDSSIFLELVLSLMNFFCFSRISLSSSSTII